MENTDMPQAEQPNPTISEQTRILAALAYIPFLCVVAFLIRERGEFLTFHARQGLVITLLSVIMAVLGPVLTIFVPFIGAIIALGLNTALALMIILGAWKAYQGEMWEMPYLGNYAKNIKL